MDPHRIRTLAQLDDLLGPVSPAAIRNEIDGRRYDAELPAR